MRLYLIRHGQTVMNVNRCYYGWTDAGLSEEGIRQAESMAPFFSNIPFDKVISSPLVRAFETAGLVLADRKEQIVTDERLKEQNFGCFEGMTYQEIQERYPAELAAWNSEFANYVIPGGESFRMVRERVDDFFRDLVKEEGTILIAAHKGTLGHLLSAMLSLPLEGYWNFVFDQGCYSMVDIEDGYAILRRLNVPCEAGKK